MLRREKQVNVSMNQAEFSALYLHAGMAGLTPQGFIRHVTTHPNAPDLIKKSV